MKRLSLFVLLVMLSLTGVTAADGGGDAVQQIYVAGYSGCYFIEVSGHAYAGPHTGEGYKLYIAPNNVVLPMRFWTYHPTYGYGLVVVEFPSHSNQGWVFYPQVPDYVTTWTQPAIAGGVRLSATNIYFPPQEQVPPQLRAVYPSACLPPAPPTGVLDLPGCLVDEIFIGVSTRPRIACRPAAGFTINHFELVVDGRVVQGDRPDNQFDVWDRAGITCAGFNYSSFWPDSSVGVIVVGNDGVRYPYRVVVRGNKWHGNDHRTALCSFNENLTQVRPKYGDTVNLLLRALELPNSAALKIDWNNAYHGLVAGVWYTLPDSWIALRGQGHH